MPDDKPEPATTPAGEDDQRAAGTVADPIPAGEEQPGDRAERAAALGGPVDVSPVRPRRR